MKSILTFGTLVSLSILLTAPCAFSQDAKESGVDLKGPISTQGATPIQKPSNTTSTPNSGGAGKQMQEGMAGMLAPGADAMMTPDLLLVTPTNQAQATPQPLKELIGNGLKLEIEKRDVTFKGFRGVVINVINDTNRALLIDGDNATISTTADKHQAASLKEIQLAIIPPHKTSQDFTEIVTHGIPDAVTIGVIPTVRDYREMHRPVLDRYGPDELRRRIEFSRFGRRILWSGQKIEGVLYFHDDADISTGKLEIPITTVFDSKDTAVLTSSL